MLRLLRRAFIGACILGAATATTLAAHGGGLDANCGHAGSQPYHYHYGNCTPQNQPQPSGPSPTPTPSATPLPAPAPAPAPVATPAPAPVTTPALRPTVPPRLQQVNLTIDGRSFTFRFSDIEWPTSCVEMNDWMELASALLTPYKWDVQRHISNIGIYERVFGDDAEVACRNDHRDDVRSAFRWAF